MNTILLIEPNENIAGVIQKYVSVHQENIEVIHASDAQDAIHQADKIKPDLVILELAMPIHNGFAFLHEFRSYEDWADVPVIVHSHLARDEASMSKSWKILQAEKYLYKPNTTLKALNEAINEVLKS